MIKDFIKLDKLTKKLLFNLEEYYIKKEIYFCPFMLFCFIKLE